MKKKEIEWENVPMDDNEVRTAQYMLDDTRLQVLVNENKLELYKYQIDNNIPKSISRNIIQSMKKDLVKYEENMKELCDKDAKDCELSDGEKSDKEIILKSTIKSCRQQIEEEKLRIELNLPARKLNQQIIDTEDTLKKNESNLKVYQNMVRNKTRKVIKSQIQLSEQVEDSK